MKFDLCYEGARTHLHHRSALKELVETAVSVLFQRAAVGKAPTTHFPFNSKSWYKIETGTFHPQQLHDSLVPSRRGLRVHFLTQLSRISLPRGVITPAVTGCTALSSFHGFCQVGPTVANSVPAPAPRLAHPEASAAPSISAHLFFRELIHIRKQNLTQSCNLG